MRPPGPAIRRLGPLAAAALLLGATAHAQPQAQSPENWLAAARTHTPGEPDASLTTVMRWSRDATFAAIDAAGRSDTDVRVLARGLILHTDIAILERASSGGAAVGLERSVRLLDGESVGSPRRTFQWDAGRLLASTIAKHPQGEPIACAWFRTVAALLQHWGDLGAVGVHLDHAGGLFPDDPVLTLYSGALHEAYAGARVQAYMAKARRGDWWYGVGKPAAELGMAEGVLRRALGIDPALVEARIRLAHVVGERGRPDEAVALAREALAGPLPRFLEYYGAMILGQNAGRLGDAAAAKAAFDRAATVFPYAQAARVASSQAALAAGRSEEAVAAILAAIGPDAPADRRDPWAWYHRLHEPQAASLVVELRASVP